MSLRRGNGGVRTRHDSCSHPTHWYNMHARRNPTPNSEEAENAQISQETSWQEGKNFSSTATPRSAVQIPIAAHHVAAVYF